VALLVPGSAGASVSRVEAESLPLPGACWNQVNAAGSSNGSYRSCNTNAQTIGWTVTVAAGETDVVTIGDRVTTAIVGGCVTVDAGSCVALSPTALGAQADQVTVFTSAPLSPGAHAFTLAKTSGLAVLFDYYDVTGTPDATTTTTAAPTTTVAPTTVPPTTTAPYVRNDSDADAWGDYLRSGGVPALSGLLGAMVLVLVVVRWGVVRGRQAAS
jgi:hypothetical protein